MGVVGDVIIEVDRCFAIGLRRSPSNEAPTALESDDDGSDGSWVLGVERIRIWRSHLGKPAFPIPDKRAFSRVIDLMDEVVGV